jgi:hypothetical protein
MELKFAGWGGIASVGSRVVRNKGGVGWEYFFEKGS